MSLAPVAPAPVAQLPDLVDGIAARTGAWVVVESLGAVVTHGAGVADCPVALASTLLGKSTAPLRAAVSWVRGGCALRGTLDALPVAAVDLGAGATAWFVGGRVEEETVPLLRSAVHDAAPVTDPLVAELLHPRGPARPGRAPQARLLVLLSQAPVAAVSRAASSALVPGTGRVHAEPDSVVVALPVEQSARDLVSAVRRRCPDVVAGSAVVEAPADDWTAAARLASAAARVARRRDALVADSCEAIVAAELLVDEAQEAALALLGPLRGGPLRRLEEHDARTSGELVATLRAWCAVGGDVATAAAVLHVHTNTLRYRLRRAAEISGLDLDRPRHVLALQLLLTE